MNTREEHKPYKILVVEDDEYYNKLLVYNLSLNPDYEVISCMTGKECLAKLSENPDVITLDFKLPDINGVEILKKIKDFNEDIQVIIISGQDDIETVVELLKFGAYDYIVKTKDIRQRLLNTINNLRAKNTLKTKIVSLQKEVQQKYDFQKSIVGESEPIKKIFTLIEKAIQTNINVTITGETGTGKELVAKAIHYNSSRKNNQMVAVNVAAIPAELIESELFGHEKGSFTGAAARRIGKFEEADGGTLFLDEIGEMDLSMQTKLLRALQEKEIVRVGNNKPVKVNCRIIVATHRNLLQHVQEGKFREDLYYRLLGLPIELPPLRERGNDILILAKYFLDAFSKENNLTPPMLSDSAKSKLLNYTFPGNIRELKALMDLAAVMSNGKEIIAEDISLPFSNSVVLSNNSELTMREYNLELLNTYLRKYNNHIPLVAQKLDISQATIYRMLKESKGLS